MLIVHVQQKDKQESLKIRVFYKPLKNTNFLLKEIWS